MLIVNALILVSLVFLSTYFLLVIFFYFQWNTISVFKPSHFYHDSLYISVVVSVRNEASNIINLLNDLEKQVFIKKYEVIIIDDHSEDDTLFLIKAYKNSTCLNLSVFQSSGTGKKAGLNLGISKAKGDIIVCTDGDCRVKEKWLTTISEFFTNNNAKLAFGPVALNNKSFSLFNEMQVIEFASLVGSGAACWKSGLPNMCNGANIAYRKDVFLEVNGFNSNLSQASGDDEFLMHSVYHKYPEDVYFIKSKAAIVTTRTCLSIKEFYYQRLRWASKWENYSDWKVQATSIYIFFVNISQVFLLLATGHWLLYHSYTLYLLLFAIFSLLVSRWIVEFVFLRSVLRFMDIRINLFAFICLVLLYPFYVVFFALAARFRKYKWKERKL